MTALQQFQQSRTIIFHSSTQLFPGKSRMIKSTISQEKLRKESNTVAYKNKVHSTVTITCRMTEEPW